MHRNHRDSTLALIDVYARQRRTALTPSEQALWVRIQRGQLGIWFRRQIRIGRFIVDFVAPAAGLVVEVDGRYHTCRRSAERDVIASSRVWAIACSVLALRLEAALVEHDLDEAVARIRAALARAR